MKRLAIIAGVVVIFVIGLLAVFSSDEEGETDTEASTLVTVTTEPIGRAFDLVRVDAQVVPLRQTELTMPTSGVVTERFVSAGKFVEAGEAILQLDSVDGELAVQQAENGLAQAVVNLEMAQLQLQSAQQDILLSQQDVTAAEIELQIALVPPTAEQVAAAQSSVTASTAAIEQAAANRDQLFAGATEAELLAAQAQLLASQADQKPLQDAYGDLQRFEIGGDVLQDVEIQLNAAVAGVNAAQANLEAVNAGASAAERQAAVATVNAAVARRDAAQAQLELLLAGAKPEEVALMRVGVQQAEAALGQTNASIAELEAAVLQAETAVTLAQIALQSAQEEVSKLTLTAPFAGIVTDLEVEVGEVVNGGVALGSLIDDTVWLIKTTDLTELDVATLSKGMTADIQFDAFPNQTISGLIEEIGLVSEIAAGDVTYEVTIRLDDNDTLPLRWGMTAQVEVDTK